MLKMKIVSLILLGPTKSAEKIKESNLVHVMEKHFTSITIIFLCYLVMLTMTILADYITEIWYLLGESFVSLNFPKHCNKNLTN